MRKKISIKRLTNTIRSFFGVISFFLPALYGCAPQNTNPTTDVNALAEQMVATFTVLTSQAPAIVSSPMLMPTHVSNMVELQNDSVITDVNGQVLFSGNIVNLSNTAIKGVKFKLKLLDEAENEIVAKDDLVCYIEPGGKRPFLSVMGYAPLVWSGASIEFQQPVLASPEVVELVQSVQLDNVSLVEYGNGDGLLKGTITNIGQKTLPFIFIGGAIYDKNENVLSLIPIGSGAGYGRDPYTLLPGISEPWEGTIDTPNPPQEGITVSAFVSNPLPLESNPCQ
jgi:hypothetical protein